MSDFVATVDTYRQGSRTLPGDYYTSRDVFREEERRIFGRRWMCVGRASEIARPGEYVLASVAGESLIVVRDREGAIRALYNVCRHRGTRMCEAERGRFPETIQCPYHAWTYDLEGRLVGAPQMKEVEDFDPADWPLHAAAVGTWEGFVFVCLDPDPEPLEEWLGPLVGRFGRFGLAGLRAERRIEYDVRANWKLLFQNYSECLHCPVIHPGLTERSPYTSGVNDLVEGPFLGGYMLLREGIGSLTESRDACAVPVGDLPEEDLRRVYYYSIFPNLLLSLHPDYVMFHTLRPRRPERTEVTCGWLFAPEAGSAPGFDPDDAVAFWDETNRQDWEVCERSQAGISSRVYRPGPYSPRESLPAAWDAHYLEVMGRAPPGRP